MKKFFALFIVIICSMFVSACSEDDQNITGNSSVITDQKHQDPLADWNEIGNMITQAKALFDLRQSGVIFPEGFRYKDEVVYQYPNYPTAGSKTTVVYRLANGETKSLVFPWKPPYQGPGPYGLSFDGRFTADGHFIMVAGRNSMSGFFPVIYVFKDGEIDKISYPTQMPVGYSGSLPLSNVSILGNTVLIEAHPGRFDYHKVRKSFDFETGLTKQVFWTVPYNYFY